MRDSEHFMHATLAVALAIIVALALVVCTSCPAGAQTSITVDRIRAANTLTLAPSGDLLVDPVGNDAYPVSNYDINLGLLTNKWLTLHAAELWVETLVAQDTIATIGGRILVGPTTSLTMDTTDSQAYICVKHNEMASGDRVVMQANAKLEFMAVTSSPTTDHASCNGTVTDYYYTVTRNLDGTGGNVWYAGDAVFNTGTVGDGYLDLYSLSSLSAQRGNLVVNTGAEVGTTALWDQAEGNFAGTFSASTTYARTGTYSFKLTVTTAGDSYGVGTHCIPVVPGQRFVVSTYTRGSGASTDGLFVRVHEDSACGGTTITAAQRSGYASVTENGAIASGTWTQSAAYYTVPAGVNVVAVVVMLYQPNTDVDLYFDDVVFYEMPGIGPTIVGNVRLTTDYNGVVPRWAIGNLNGLYGFSASTYGAAFGNPADAYVTIDDTYGIRMIEGGSTVRGQWAIDGSLMIGSSATGNGNFYVDTSGNAYLRVGTTNKIGLTTAGNIDLTGTLTVGSAGAIKSGVTDWSTGTGWYADYNGGTPRFRVGGTTGTRFMWDGSQMEIVSADITIDGNDQYISISNTSSTAGGFLMHGTLGMRASSTALYVLGGSAGTIVSGGNLYPGGTQDLGDTTTRWRSAYLNTNLYVGQDIYVSGMDTTTAGSYVLVTDSGWVKAKTDATDRTLDCTGTSVKAISFELGLYVGSGTCNDVPPPPDLDEIVARLTTNPTLLRALWRAMEEAHAPPVVRVAARRRR